MNSIFDDPTVDFLVVKNGEGQYSIWPSGRELPKGWSAGGKAGKRDECLAFIKETWVDMRPESLKAKPTRT